MSCFKMINDITSKEANKKMICGIKKGMEGRLRIHIKFINY